MFRNDMIELHTLSGLHASHRLKTVKISEEVVDNILMVLQYSSNCLRSVRTNPFVVHIANIH